MNFALIVLSYNHPILTGRAVASGLALGIPPEKVVLVHNGSEAKHARALQADFPAIRHVIIEKNSGYGGGVNRGLREGFQLADWCILLTNDSQLLSLPRIPAAPKVVAPCVYRRKEGIVDSIGGRFRPSRGKLEHCRTPEAFRRLEIADDIRYIPGTAFLVHRRAFESAGPLREDFCIYWDDVEWSRRTASAGFMLDADPDWKVLHGVGRTCHSKPIYTLYYFQRNRKWVSWKYARGPKKALLAARLAADWTRLGLKLIGERRISDLRYFVDFVRA